MIPLYTTVRLRRGTQATALDGLQVSYRYFPRGTIATVVQSTPGEVEIEFDPDGTGGPWYQFVQVDDLEQAA